MTGRPPWGAGRPRLAAAGVGLALLAAACGGASGTSATGASRPSTPLGRLVASLGPLRSGVLSMNLTATTAASAGTAGAAGTANVAGFQISGPFQAAARKGALPRLRLTLDELGPAASAPVTLVSTGTSSYVLAGGRQLPLSAAQAQQVAATAGPGADLTGLRQLGVASWAEGPETVRTVSFAGTAAQEIATRVDPVAALNGLIKIASATGATGALHPVSGQAARLLRGATTSATLTVIAGAKDHLLRSFVLRLQFAPPGASQLKQALGPYSGLSLVLSLRVSRPDQVTLS